ncbi:MAG: hypothetical protein KJ736_06390 [Candidatus Omnitrophica bacterium]|nr:hypothetical protein [Candidatus Omnitrophota bacterium]
MRYMLMIVVAFLLMLTLQGCETLIGATSGLQKDIENLRSQDGELYETDAWLKENLW